MALSIIEMNYIQNGIVRPLESNAQDLVNTVALRHSQYLKTNTKTVDPENTEAMNCLNKQNILLGNIMNRNTGTLQNIFLRTILQMGNITVFSDVRGWSIGQWETFLETNIPEIFDGVANITTAERTAYNAI